MSIERELLKEIFKYLWNTGASGGLVSRIESELAKPNPEPACFADKSDIEKVTKKIGSGGFISQSTHLTNTSVNGKIPLYTSPPARKPMSDDEINSIKFYSIHSDFDAALRRFARAIEKAHGIK
jgi:hypothetical protein